MLRGRLLLCAQGPWFRPRYGRGDGLKLFCYIDAIDPDYWFLRKKEEGQKGGECNDVKRLA